MPCCRLGRCSVLAFAGRSSVKMVRCSGGAPKGLWRVSRVLSAAEVGNWKGAAVERRCCRVGSRAGLGSRKSRGSTRCRAKQSMRSWRRVMCRMVMFAGVLGSKDACAYVAGVRAVDRLLRC